MGYSEARFFVNVPLRKMSSPCSVRRASSGVVLWWGSNSFHLLKQTRCNILLQQACRKTPPAVVNEFHITPAHSVLSVLNQDQNLMNSYQPQELVLQEKMEENFWFKYGTEISDWQRLGHVSWHQRKTSNANSHTSLLVWNNLRSWGTTWTKEGDAKAADQSKDMCPLFFSGLNFWKILYIIK
jgi:hypothetical protein